MTHSIKSSLTAGDFNVLKFGTDYLKLQEGAFVSQSRALTRHIHDKKIPILRNAELKTADGQHVRFKDLVSAEQKLAFVDQMAEANLKHYAIHGFVFVGKNGLNPYKGWVTHRVLKQEIWHTKNTNIKLYYAMPEGMGALAQDLAFYFFARKETCKKDNGITGYKTLEDFSAYINTLSQINSPKRIQLKHSKGGKNFLSKDVPHHE